jgi:hypothetical protein
MMGCKVQHVFMAYDCSGPGGLVCKGGGSRRVKGCEAPSSGERLKEGSSCLEADSSVIKKCRREPRSAILPLLP